jgi:hypothetical protein
MALSSIEDRYLSALTAAQFPDMPADEPVMPVDAAGMDSPNLDGMQLAAGPSRTMSDAGGGMGEMKAYDPTTRERLASFLQSGFEGLGMDRVKARQRAQTLIGGPSSNLPLSLGLADIVPIIGTGLQTEEAARMGQEAVTSAQQGNLGTAALQAGGAVLGMVPGAVGTARAAKPVVQMIGKSLTPKGAKLTPNIEVPAAGDITKPAFKKWFGDSKVTNDAGQPIVVYHARAGDFDSFDTAGRGKTKGTGAFFSSSADVASTYGVKGDENIVPAYLSMKRPVVIDANGSNWSDIDMGAKISVPEIKVSDIEEQQLLAELTGSAVDESAMKTIPAAEMSLGELKINNKLIDRKVNTDDIARWARKMGYDGLIIKNVIDSGPSGRYMPDEAMNPHNVYVAFEPTQIKSVFNKGTWNPDDPRMVQGAGAATAGTGAATMSDKEQK